MLDMDRANNDGGYGYIDFNRKGTPRRQLLVPQLSWDSVTDSSQRLTQKRAYFIHVIILNVSTLISYFWAADSITTQTRSQRLDSLRGRKRKEPATEKQVIKLRQNSIATSEYTLEYHRSTQCTPIHTVLHP